MELNGKQLIYLDNNATTPIDPRVLEAMMPFLTDLYGNAASNHMAGALVKKEVDQAREKVANLIACQPNELIFTSGATEAINLAVKGLVEANPQRNHLITVATEHKAMLDVFGYLERKGVVTVTYLSVDHDGLIDLNELKEAVAENTLLVSVMLVNNETGVIQPIKQIAEIAHEKGAFFMTDATQAVGKMPIDVEAMGIDLFTLSAHKFYGPKGIGALYVRYKKPFRVKLEALIHGGGHERSLRSGTLNVPGIVGLGKAAELALAEMKQDAERIGALRDELEKALLEIPDTFINGHAQQRLYNTCNICIKGVDADALMTGMKHIIVSNGSACTSTSITPSHVLTAMGLDESDVFDSVRISLGKVSKRYEIKSALGSIAQVVVNLKSIMK
jgi:cysteine desulfurase